MSNSIGLYIHIPFCVKKCHYCTFSSFADISDEIKDKYLDKLIKEIVHKTRDLKNKNVKWIYFGGGTPNTLSVDQLSKIVEVLPKGFEELSIELNPHLRQGFGGQAGIGYLRELSLLGFNRISIGVQSFEDSELKLLGRIHDSETAKAFISNVKDSGFENFNIDLMIGLPGQTVDTVLRNIEIADGFGPTHISAYMLSIDSGTHFENLYEKGLLELPNEEQFEEIYFSAVSKLGSLGYKQYEISNFAKPDFECKYNLNTWRNGEYIGCGLGAGSFVDGKRFDNTKDFNNYLNNPVGAYCNTPLQINPVDNFETKILLGLRLREGVDLYSEFENLSNDYKSMFIERIEGLVSDGLLSFENDRLIISSDKVLLTDFIIEKLLI